MSTGYTYTLWCWLPSGYRGQSLDLHTMADVQKTVTISKHLKPMAKLNRYQGGSKVRSRFAAGETEEGCSRWVKIETQKRHDRNNSSVWYPYLLHRVRLGGNRHGSHRKNNMESSLS